MVWNTQFIEIGLYTMWESVKNSTESYFSVSVFGPEISKGQQSYLSGSKEGQEAGRRMRTEKNL